MRVALYARVSSEKQDVDLSISAQLKALREYTERNGHVIVREFVEEAESGRSISKLPDGTRPIFKQVVYSDSTTPAFHINQEVREIPLASMVGGKGLEPSTSRM